MEPELLELNELAKKEGKEYEKKRFIYETVKKYLKEKEIIAIVGPRGVGKSVLLKQLLNELEKSFYISLDTVLPEKKLFEIAKELESKGIKYLFLDEVHFYPNFEKEIKKIFDFLKIKLIITSSSSLLLTESSYDLSRRVRLLYMFPFSFREFLYFKEDKKIEKITFDDIVNEKKCKKIYSKVFDYEHLFEEYLQGRNYPFVLEKEDYLPLFKNILNRIITNDLLKRKRIPIEDISLIKKMCSFIGKAEVEGISFSSISKNVGITKYKAEKFVDLLEKAFLIQTIFPRGTNVLKEPKILFTLPYRLLYKNYENCIGGIREDFFVSSIKGSGFEIYYLKSKRGEKTPDYLIQDVVFEIGGISKGVTQFKGFKAKKKIILTHPGKLEKDRRPLFLVGFLY